MAVTSPLWNYARRSVRRGWRWIPPRAVVLLFHRVVEQWPTSPQQQQGCITVETFERIIAHVRARFQPIAVPALAEAVRRRAIPPGAVAITFDDGFADNLHLALPVLERHRVPATVYLTTGYLDRSVPPLETVLARLIRQKQTLELPSATGATHWRLTSEAERQACFNDLRNRTKWLPPRDRQDVLQAIGGDAATCAEDWSAYLDWSEAARLAASPWITIGNHTHSHPALSGLDADTIRADILTAQQRLDEKLDLAAQTFAYPYGDATPAVRAVLRDLGFDHAMATTRDGLRWCGVDAFTIPRIEPTDGRLVETDSIPALVRQCASS